MMNLAAVKTATPPGSGILTNVLFCFEPDAQVYFDGVMVTDPNGDGNYVSHSDWCDFHSTSGEKSRTCRYPPGVKIRGNSSTN